MLRFVAGLDCRLYVHTLPFTSNKTKFLILIKTVTVWDDHDIIVLFTHKQTLRHLPPGDPVFTGFPVVGDPVGPPVIGGLDPVGPPVIGGQVPPSLWHSDFRAPGLKQYKVSSSLSTAL